MAEYIRSVDLGPLVIDTNKQTYTYSFDFMDIDEIIERLREIQKERGL